MAKKISSNVEGPIVLTDDGTIVAVPTKAKRKAKGKEAEAK